MSLLYDLPSESLANSWTLSSTSPSSPRCLHWACKPTLSDRFVQFLNNFTFGLFCSLRWPILWSFPKFLGLAIRKPTWSDGSVLVLSILILLQYLRFSWFLYLLITECPLFIFSSKPRMVKMKTCVWQQFAFSTLESIPSRSAHTFLGIVYSKIGIVV